MWSDWQLLFKVGTWKLLLGLLLIDELAHQLLIQDLLYGTVCPTIILPRLLRRCRPHVFTRMILFDVIFVCFLEMPQLNVIKHHSESRVHRGVILSIGLLLGMIVQHYIVVVAIDNDVLNDN